MTYLTTTFILNPSHMEYLMYCSILLMLTFHKKVHYLFSTHFKNNSSYSWFSGKGTERNEES